MKMRSSVDCLDKLRTFVGCSLNDVMIMSGVADTLARVVQRFLEFWSCIADTLKA